MKRIFRNLYYHYLRSQGNSEPIEARRETRQVSPSLLENLNELDKALGSSDDVVFRRFKLGINHANAFILFIDGLVDKNLVAENIIKPIISLTPLADNQFPDVSHVGELVIESLLTAGEVQEEQTLQTVLDGVLIGQTALFIEGCNKAILISSQGFENRGVEEPATEAVIRGPREGFSEPLRINTSLIRRKIKNPNLQIETFTLGRQTKTKVAIAYVKGIANEEITKELKERISRIDTDEIFGAAFIEAFIEDAPFSLFPTMGVTERPDVAAARIVEGRVAIITDGTPTVLTVPHLFVESFQTADDYLNRFHFMTLVRWLRFLAFFLTVFLPSLYIALVTYHQEMIPTPLLMTIAASREGTPFPAFVEAIGMGVIFELLREAGIRMPRPVGQAVSIVGALVIGDAAVSAGLVGEPMVIITALTAITSFINSSKIDVTVILRLLSTVFAAVAGLYGILIGTLITMIHLTALRSFGVPYMSPLSPLNVNDLKDVLIRAPIWAMNIRPRVLTDGRRQAPGQKPGPPRARNKS